MKPHEERNIERLMNRCEHFNGIMVLGSQLGRDEDKRCEAGVRYEDVRGPGPGHRPIPCFKDRSEGSRPCASAKFPTRDEAEAEERKATARLRERFAQIAAGICPNHKVKVVLRQAGPCVYGSCGCRLYHGKLAKTTKP